MPPDDQIDDLMTYRCPKCGDVMEAPGTKELDGKVYLIFRHTMTSAGAQNCSFKDDDFPVSTTE
ncbi:hypothetical protein C4561_04970 [candidate division WWE3 bacterium]|jgi:hypothetical protein|uniref:Uncharacterized protein n=1 Tax=candidate division WWE3 bacterium TaxID=2053526 RepID=A0A3A4ZAY4_UNCKA|nr:MAG: hypothetical protein C4561_04970 [candidate division WWE3 bacterium]